jgi:hypothetical protein
MPIDPKLRPAPLVPQSTVAKPEPKPSPSPATTKAPPRQGFAASSTFDSANPASREDGSGKSSTRAHYLAALKQTAATYLETPSYLRPGAVNASSPDISSAVAALAPGQRKSMSNLLAGDSPVSKVVTQVLASATWSSLASEETASVAKVLCAADEKGVLSLGALIEGTPEAAGWRDSRGQSLFSNLAQLATQPLNASLYKIRAPNAWLDRVLLEIANPNRLASNPVPCSPGSLHFELVRDDPAEYARLITGLTGLEGAATMRGGGQLRLPAKVDAPSLFQASVLEFAHRERATAPHAGLLPAQQTQLLQQLLGIDYAQKPLTTRSDRAFELEALRVDPPAKNRPTVLVLDEGHRKHVVTFEMERNSRVFFRDPHGELRSMPDEAFLKYVVAVHRPQPMQA